MRTYQAATQISSRRPRGLLVVVVIQALLGLLGIVGGIGSLAAPHLPQPQGLGFLQPLAPVFPVVLVVIGSFLLLLCAGLWQGFGWAWTATIVFELVHIVADIGFIAARSFAVDKFIGLAIILGLLTYLTRRNVRAYFGKAAPAQAAHLPRTG